MSKIITITGVDGTGKTTLIESLQKHFKENKKLKFLRVPQFNLSDPSIEFSEHVGILENLGKKADEFNLPVIKANVSFLQFELLGKALSKIDKNTIVVLERFPLLDSLVFAKFYLPLLKKNQNTNYESFILSHLTQEEILTLKEIISIEELGQYHLKLIDIFSLDELTCFKTLEQILGNIKLSKAYLLKASDELLAERLKLSTKTKEAHENLQTLKMLQGLIPELFKKYSSFYPNFKWEEIGIDGKDMNTLSSEFIKYLSC